MVNASFITIHYSLYVIHLQMCCWIRQQPSLLIIISATHFWYPSKFSSFLGIFLVGWESFEVRIFMYWWDNFETSFPKCHILPSPSKTVLYSHILFAHSSDLNHDEWLLVLIVGYEGSPHILWISTGQNDGDGENGTWYKVRLDPKDTLIEDCKRNIWCPFYTEAEGMLFNFQLHPDGRCSVLSIDKISRKSFTFE